MRPSLLINLTLLTSLLPVLLNALDLARALLVVRIRFALMQLDAFDDPVRPRALRHRDAMLIRITAVSGDGVGHPPGCGGNVRLISILLE